MMTRWHQRLQLSALMLLSIAILQVTSTRFDIRPPRNYPTLREARREAHLGTPGGWKEVDVDNRAVQSFATQAAKEASVKHIFVLQAFRTVGPHTIVSLRVFPLYYITRWLHKVA